MISRLPTQSEFAKPIRGRIIEAEVKISANPAEPLPLACAVYAIETLEGIWLCVYYGVNRGVFDYLPQKDAAVDEQNLGIAFHAKEFVPTDYFKPEVWEDFKKRRLMICGGPGS